MKKRARKNGKQNLSLGQEMLTATALAAFRDESYSLIVRWVEEALKDPELRKKIEYHTRAILKAIAEKI